MVGKWTKTVLALLPATLKEINANPEIQLMNSIHRAQRKKAGKIAKPINSMAYDTLYRLRNQAVVERRKDGVYQLTPWELHDHHRMLVACLYGGREEKQ